ncbi:MAG: hypothetical protein PHV37_08985 [Candidatus Gastranaerophilales bacterium]|nr:hypothetical protein [Candidatus Gastranaerophilales bacterium]
MGRIINKLKTIYIKIDDCREEKLKTFLANDILKGFDEFKNADDLRKAAALAVVNAVSAYAATYGMPALTDDVKNQIAEQSAKVFKKLNKKLQDKLNKKSKAYLKRHGEVQGD